LGGEGRGEEGWHDGDAADSPPHPNPLRPQWGGEGEWRRDLWPLIACPDAAPAPADPAALAGAVARFGLLAGPALADLLLRPAAARLGIALPDPAAVARSRLAGRFALAPQRRWVAAIADAGIEAVCLKGFAIAHTHYADPAARILGDLDLLVRAADLDRTIRLLAGHGFRFRTAAAPRSRMMPDASFMPLVAADGACDIDLHVQPDSYPAWRALTAERVFAESRTVRADGLEFRAPSPDHAFLLCVTNAAKDKFGLFSLRKVIDAMLLVRPDPRRGAAGLDWDAIEALARSGHFRRPLRVLCALLARLGVSGALLPPALSAAPRGIAGPAFARLAADFEALFPSEPSMAGLWWREVTLAAEPDIVLRNLIRRLAGLVRPSSGLPPGVSPRTGLPKDLDVARTDSPSPPPMG
jgi:hypothetical protein